MEDQKEDVPKKEVPKKEDLKPEVLKKEDSKKEVPKDEVLIEQIQKSGAPDEQVQRKDPLKDSVPNNVVPKRGVPKNSWFSRFIEIFLATLFATLIAGWILYHITSETNENLPQAALYDDARELAEGRDYTGALGKLEQLPDYVPALLLSGRIYSENLKQYQSAIEKFRMDLANDSTNKSALYHLGYTYYKIGDLKLAIEYNQKALVQDPDFIVAIYRNAIYHADYGEKYNDSASYREAIDQYENVIKRGREFADSARINLEALKARLLKEQKADSIR